RRGVLLFADRRLAYPPDALSMLRALGPRAGLSLGAGLLASAARRRAFAAWDRDRPLRDDEPDQGFERFVIARVGEPAYEAFYRPYAEKVWGLPPSELSQSVAKRRISTTRPWALARDFLGRIAASLEGHPRDERAPGFIYPTGGVSSIIAWLEARLAEHHVPIERGRAFDPREPRRATTLYAGDLRDLTETPLEHRGLYLVWLAFAVDRLAEPETYYSPDARHYFGRVSELQNYSPALRRPGETILCVEIPQGRWSSNENFTRGKQGEALLAQLAEAGIVPRGLPPIEIRQRFLPSVYPLYRRGWLGEWRAAMRRIAALGDVLPFGRQALFLHVNLDHCADIAEDAVAHIEAGESTQAWIAQAEHYLELRVRD
ncbi:MAG: UDP-galactopyranose mutase, partial [Minicystis sp.]